MPARLFDAFNDTVLKQIPNAWNVYLLVSVRNGTFCKFFAYEKPPVF